MAAILDFPSERFKLFLIYKLPWYFLPSFESTVFLVQEKSKIDFQVEGHLGFPTGMILANFDPQGALIFPTKFQVNLPFVSGGCELSTTTGVKTAWKKFKDLLPVLSSRHLSFKTRCCVYSSCVWSAMLHASETWPLKKPNLQGLQWNDRAMIWQICNVRPQDIITTRSNELLVQLGIEDLDLILKERRLMVWTCGTLQWCSQDIQVDGKRGPGRPKMTWKQLTDRLQRVEALGYQPSR